MTGFDAARQLGLGLLMLSLFCAAPASAQEATDATAETTVDSAVAEEVLPEVDVIQDTPKQRRAKKKQVQVSPLSKAASTPTPASTPAAVAGTSEASEADPVSEEVQTVAPVTVPSAVSIVSEQDVKREGTKKVQHVLEQQVPSVTLSDAAGNPARAELQFRGFDSSPVTGRAQGLAVYQNGIRVNEAFGDTVNWSFIPTNAIESISIVSNNPAFGLNALGGAASIILKDGFSFQGVEFDIMGGSFGRIQTGLQLGASSGNAAVYTALEGIWEDGFRDFSETDVKRFYGDIGLRGSMAEVHFSLTAAQNDFGATAAVPVELLARDYSNTFTSPQTTDLEMYMPSISGTVKATDTLTLSGVAYYRYYKNDVVDGNVTENAPCEAGSEGEADGATVGVHLCGDDGDGEAITTLGGAFIDVTGLDPLGSIERLNTESRSWGAVFELQERAKLFNRPNQFIFGVSYDRGETNYQTSSELGVIGPKFVVDGTGIIVRDEENEVSPRNLDSTNTYWGIYFTNAFDVTDQLTVTVGGRWNHATIKLEDLTGDFDGLNATNTYVRFNPQVGANYKITPGLSIYGGYSESNRAPTPAELGCAEPDPEDACLLETFLTDDPPLAQVVGRTAEIGLRGQGRLGRGQFSWGAGLFRTLAEDDILPSVVTDGGATKVFFTNGGDTLRQGVELYAAYGIERNWNVYGSYAFVDATLDECTQPDPVTGQCAFLNEGDRLGGIPRHLFKAGFEYWITSKWKFGADMIASGDRPFFRTDASEDRYDRLAGFTRVDLHTSYDVNEHIQLYGLVKNLFDQKYGLYGTHFEADEVSEVDVDLGGAGLNDPRTISPSHPFAAYGGIRIKY